MVPQDICLQDILMLNGLWIFRSHYSGCSLVWKDTSEQIQIMGTKNQEKKKKRISSLHSELEIFGWAIKSMMDHSTCQNFGSNCKYFISMIEESHVLSNFSTELNEISALQRRLQSFKIFYIPQTQMQLLIHQLRLRNLFIKIFLTWNTFSLSKKKQENQHKNGFKR